MNKWITVIIIIACLILGSAAGYYNAIHDIVDVDKSDAGFQVYFEDGTGYWYEY